MSFNNFRQSNSAYTCCRTISLTESVENHIELVFCNTDSSVADTELECDILIIESQQPGAESYMAFSARLLGRVRREFNSISNQVRDDLSETQGIANELVRNVRLNIVREIDLVLRSTDNQSFEDPKDCLP